MPDGSFAHPQQRQFNPYTDNGGTILAIAGADFSVIAGDTRQSEGYSIQTRYAPKVFRLCVDRPESLLDAGRSLANVNSLSLRAWMWMKYRTDRAVLAVNGFAADGNMFVKKVKQRLEVRPVSHLPSPLSPTTRSVSTATRTDIY